MRGLPEQETEPRRHRHADDYRREPQQDAKPFLRDVQMNLLKLFVKMMALVGDQGALVGGKSPLLAEKRVCFVTAGTAQGKCHGNGINA
jgi:hypothetical protein